jgi:hypothetical protein
MIDGFRYGFFGLSDIAPGVSLAFVAAAAVVLAALALALLARGWKQRHRIHRLAWSPQTRSGPPSRTRSRATSSK